MLPLFYKNRNIFIFSNPDSRSLILARSIRETDKSAAVIFAGGSNADKESIAAVKRAGCRIYRRSIESVGFKGYAPNSTIRVILTSADEDANLKSALRLTKRLRGKVNAEIYTFNTSKASECLLDSVDKGGGNNLTAPVKIRRVNAVRNQIYLDLLNNSLFEEAVEEYDEKVISVLIVGFGQYGTEMLKAVLWCGQMDGYTLRAHVIDKNPDIESIFYRQCPGILQRGSQPRSGEDYYELNFYGGIDVNTHAFNECIENIGSVSLALVSLGDENLNIASAMTLRSVFSGIKIDGGGVPEHSRAARQKPRIIAVTHNPEKAALLKENRLSNYNRQYYQIDCMGADTDLYSYDNIFIPQLEAMALQTHLQWGTADDFDNYEYNRRSSMTSAIHKKYRDMLMPDDETKDILEHKRWNAYMRGTEGYSFGYIRDDLALRHPLLTKYDNLSRAEKDKDAKMNSVGTPPVF